MQLTPRIALEIASHEALIRQAYKDSEGVWTWSIGLTNGSGHDVTRYIGKPQTLEQCLSVYAWALTKYAAAVEKEFEGHNLTEAQFGAALSFHWNTGKIGIASWPDLWKAGKIEEAKKSFLSWRYPAEIQERRQKEAALFFSGIWSNSGKTTEYTRLTSSNTPDWKSAVSLDIREPLERLMTGIPMPPVQDAQVPALVPEGDTKLDRLKLILAEAQLLVASLTA